MQLLASQPVSIAKILDASIRLFTASFTKLIGFFLIMAVFYISLGLLTERLVGSQPTAPADAQQALMLTRLPMILGIVFIFSMLSFVFYIGMVYRIDNVANQREDSFIEALQLGFKKFPAMLVAIILYTLAYLVGLALFVIPGIIVSLSLAFFLYFIVIDSLGGYAALKASHKLVWGHWWRTMAVFMAPSVVLIVLYFSMGLLVAFLGGIGNPVFNTLINTFSNLLSAFITPYFFTLGYVQFHDLKLRKSGADLEARLAK